MIRISIIASLLSLSTLCQAQTSFIVRVADQNTDQLLPLLLDPVLGKGSGQEALFEGVLSINPVYLGVYEPGKRAEFPIPAFTISVEDSAALEVQLERWRALSGIQYAHPNYQYALDYLGPALTEPLADSLEHLTVIRALEAWTLTKGSNRVRIGQIDSGIYFEHPDLQTQIWINPGEDLNNNGTADPSDFNGIDDDQNGFIDDVHGFDFVDRLNAVEQGDLQQRDPFPVDENIIGGGRGHGTTVAGVLIAAGSNNTGISGIAPGSRVVPLRAFGPDGIGDDDDIAAAIVYAAQMNIEVLNLSFGDIYYSQLMKESIEYAAQRGVVMVASAGNLGGDGPHYPSDFPEVISAIWLTQEGTSISGRGTHGVGIDLGAPGSQIYTTLLPTPEAVISGALTTEAYYGRRSGSSISAPMISAAAALLLSADSTLSPASVRSILTSSARDIGQPGWDHFTGAGLLDTYAALIRSLPARVEILDPPAHAGSSETQVVIRGSVIDPSFSSYHLDYAPGDGDPQSLWTAITDPTPLQKLNETLGVWDLSALSEGLYTLRLQVQLRTGRTIEDRRRFYVDRSEPEIDLHILDDGLIQGKHGIVVDLGVDDLSTVEMICRQQGMAFQTMSDRLARRHGLSWQDENGLGGLIDVEIKVTNAAGLTTVISRSIHVPTYSPNTAFLSEQSLQLPHGFLLPKLTDFDQDGLKELTLNQYQDGWLGDTLVTYEYDGQSFRKAQQLLANVFPRDVGDSNRDGRLELLTQVSAATLLLEQPTQNTYPTETIFLDTTGLSNPFDSDATFGALLTDLDRDERGEILAHNTREWRVLEYDGSSYQEVARLVNPTSNGNSEIEENEYQEPEAAVSDFDGDGKTDLLVGDSDGDWIMYEAVGDNTFNVSWTYETTRYNAGSRFTSGDFDGDGQDEFVTFTQNWTQITQDRERQPDTGLYYFWDSVADDQYMLADSLPISFNLSRHGALSAADFDLDGKDELIISQPPALYVLGFDASMRWNLKYLWGPVLSPDQVSIRSISLATGTLEEGEAPSLFVAGSDQELHWFKSNTGAFSVAPPRWKQAIANSQKEVYLSWEGTSYDSVTVFSSLPGKPFSPDTTVLTASITLQISEVLEYGLRGYQGAETSPLSIPRRVRPHTPASVSQVTYPSAHEVEVQFTEKLASGTQAAQFTLGTNIKPRKLILGREGASAILSFEGTQRDTLRWEGLLDAEGTPVGQTNVFLIFPEVKDESLIVTAWEIQNTNTLRLVFNAPLDPAYASLNSLYTVLPQGEVVSASHTPENPNQIVLTITGRVIGATGQETSIKIMEMRGASGQMLPREGLAIRLVQAAEDLTDVYIYPNPYREGINEPHITVAGLPTEATIQILTIEGIIIQNLQESNGNGGLQWDLRDNRGQKVPSGVYLFRIEAPDKKPILRKSAIIR